MIKISLIYIPGYIISSILASIVLEYMITHNPYRIKFQIIKSKKLVGSSLFSTRITNRDAIYLPNLQLYKISSPGFSSIISKELLDPTLVMFGTTRSDVDWKYLENAYFYDVFAFFYGVSLWFMVFLIMVPYNNLSDVLPKWDPVINYALLIVLSVGLLEASISYIFALYRNSYSLIYSLTLSVIAINATTFGPAMRWIDNIEIFIRITYQVVINILAVLIVIIVHSVNSVSYRYRLFAYTSSASYAAFATILLYSLVEKAMLLIH
ncbi:TVG1093558 [Thermoplasma volcanium GSS1]|uniref:TVG1093558 protein n=1 Tax=Thermoplasma volcanium (strain ATCC 51530 / DSM 4299 / JCM 9571 / NBRC 15438 / GSS1) TaxID=273116 RepID=Q979U3_THEVO|nr:hypothetical protein [Thermoplasma volcanium]BAB60209.1 TVG1093558 [Thermoplasma volcanium GSS1]